MSTTKNCGELDWYELGRSQGARGNPFSTKGRFDRCPSNEIKDSMALYRNGYNAGISEYCKPQNGFELGRSGGHYNNSCPVEVEAFFVRSYHMGIESYLLERSQQKMNSEISRLRSELLNPELSADKITDYKKDLKSLTKKSEDVSAKISGLKKEVSTSSATF